MKKLSAGILIILLALQSFYPLAVFSIYFANQDFIASVLCENIDVPELNCKGSCVVDKQLKKAEESKKDQQGNPVVQVNLFSDFYTVYLNTPAYPIEGKIYPPHREVLFANGFNSECFNPPKQLI